MQIILSRQFPNSQKEPFTATSYETGIYNCIAWACGYDDRWYWPSDDNPVHTWPDGVLKNETISAFIQLFESLGYEVCDNASLEDGYTKIAIFEKSEKPTHAARQLNNGLWTSKLGQYKDVSHTIESMNGGDYGTASVFLKKQS